LRAVRGRRFFLSFRLLVLFIGCVGRSLAVGRNSPGTLIGVASGKVIAEVSKLNMCTIIWAVLQARPDMTALGCAAAVNLVRYA
jgi:hypothetical protein